MKNYNILVDMGHGGLDSNGKYTTAPDKMFTFPNGEVICEGVINRQIGKKVFNNLSELGYCPSYIFFPEESVDMPLEERVEIINYFNPKKTIGISFHSNASLSHNARGFEIFTSKGETESDIIATYIGKEIIEEFPDDNFRPDYVDGDLDKENQFYILRKTLCPMVLIESLFFDNIEDAKLLKSESFQDRLALSISNGIIKYLKYI
ncbi:MAG: N-acetylmuramoyl-L-alanine amidase [Flavobacteriaceae bacterium]|jgi:N-acetylmuramoyl-L-alanine amidase